MRNSQWELRFDWTLTVLHWGALAIGLLLSASQLDSTSRVTGAALIAGGYVVVMQVMPRRLRAGRPLGEILAIAGVLAGVIAVGLTGSVTSPYLLFLAAPVFFAAVFFGARIGLETALLASIGLAITAGFEDQDLISGEFLQAVAFYLLIAVTFAQARRLLVEQRALTESLQEATALTARRMERLSAANGLLESLQDLADTSDLNPVTVGEAALRDLSLLAPFRGGRVTVERDGSSLTVARRGVQGRDDEAEHFAMSVGGVTVGDLYLWPDDPFDREIVADALRPVALAFENIRLLKEIAHRAVREERVRLARELHDHLGPSVATLGLGIDMAIHQHEPTPRLSHHLETLRSSATRLVEDIRAKVSDLRHEDSPSIVEHATRLAAEAGAEGPAILVDIDERRPPRPAVSFQLQAILREALRNALDHAAADTISVSGLVDWDHGKIAIVDNGSGFDPTAIAEGHYGLVGMKERATKIDGEVVVESTSGRGTTVSVHWGPS
ncbi:MAG: hypothetical protein HKN93_02270 [Acidimicrobiia bacterium]|nr:hypothetical protein [Acidimicrobiia bacterium]